MPSIKQLEDQGRVLLEQQKSLVEDTTRNWSEKRDEYDRIEADVKSILEQHTALKSVSRDPFGEAATRPPPSPGRGPQVHRRGVHLVQGLPADRRHRRQGLPVHHRRRGREGHADHRCRWRRPGAAAVPARRAAAAVPAAHRRRPDAQRRQSGNSIIYMRESAVTNAAATVAEGGLKPASDINYAQVTETFKKIANTLKISDEMLSGRSLRPVAGQRPPGVLRPAEGGAAAPPVPAPAPSCSACSTAPV
jgi:hypothetical protein